MEELQAGDVVMLKSGGPKMTVVGRVNRSGTIYYDCAWFADNRFERAPFTSPALVKVS